MSGASRVHVPVPATRQNSTGTAHPPLTGVVPTSQWCAQRYHGNDRRPSWWRRFLPGSARTS